MLNRRVYSVIVMLSFALTGCNEDIGSSFSESETNRLLSLDGSKTWFLTARSIDGEATAVSASCGENVNLVFVNGENEDSLYIVEKIRYCELNDTPDTVLLSDYTLSVDVDDNFLGEILLSETIGINVERMMVNELFTQDLRITYALNEQEIIDTYIYIPERFITSVEANKVLSDYTTKTWTLITRFENEIEVALEDCTDSKNIVFVNSDVDMVYFIEQVIGCEEDVLADTILIANYTLGRNEFDEFNGVMSLDLGESGAFGVVSLSTNELRLSYINSSNVEIIEEYSYP